MSLVSCYHETRVVIFVRLVYVRSVSDQVFDYVQSSVKAGGPEGSAQGLGGVIHVRPGSHQALHDAQVTSARGAPKSCCSYTVQKQSYLIYYFFGQNFILNTH